MSREAAVSVPRHDIAGTVQYTDTVVAAPAIVAIEDNVLAAKVEAVGVRGKIGGLGAADVVRRGVNEVVCDLDVLP